MARGSKPALLAALWIGCGTESVDPRAVESLPLSVRSPTGLVVLEWNPSNVVARIDGFSVERAANREGPFEEFYFLDHSRRTLVDISHQEGERSFYRVLGLQGSRVVATSQVSAVTSTDILPATRIESAPPANLETNQTTIRFSGESLIDGEIRLYTWRLDGNPWSQPTDEREVTLNAMSIGPHEFEVRALDETGNLDPTPATVTFAVELDNNPRLTVNENQVATSEREMRLALGANGGVVEMQVSEDPTFEGVAWQRFENGTAFVVSDSDGTKTVYVRYRLQNGQETATVSDTIILDRSPPTGQVLAPTDGAAFTRDAVSIFGEVVDVSPVTAHFTNIEDDTVAGTFTLPEVPLVVGDNPIEIELEDAVGLTAVIRVTVWRHPSEGPCAF